MKQIIILACSIMLGVILVNMIIGHGGIGEKAESVWQKEYELRSVIFDEPISK